ncbi:uncharacterized protein Z518_00442 [Rhinocladiella mackenziei CBS 650.93]|uniref:Uncharacterized protein n=1 Tax=Rhinocladiella mackenziei CBS 650.93 TaxID=1442369 RepID=A0A0D2HF88_9EURO|nr:uncharacterized protein Z518_00442 [Rhinocladiella mackenziei CBS 650.93]KIX09363.1 hypothetical protein Z518_00442 [Rhinocladiella mackenziei CBS 650.93]
MSNQGQEIKFAPAYVGTPIDAKTKLGYLREALDDKSLEFQRKNIEFLIRYYENGGKVPAPGQTMWLVDGKVVDKMPETLSKPSAMWAEVATFHQLIQSGQPGAIQLAQSTHFWYNAQSGMHEEIFARFKLPAVFGGNQNVMVNVSIMNDTGSNVQTVFPMDLAALQYNPVSLDWRW